MRWHAPVCQIRRGTFYAIKVTNNNGYCSEEIFVFFVLNNAENMTRNYLILLQHLVLQKSFFKRFGNYCNERRREKDRKWPCSIIHELEREKCSMLKSMCDGAVLSRSFSWSAPQPPAVLCLYVLFGCSFFAHRYYEVVKSFSFSLLLCHLWFFFPNKEFASG